MENHQLIYAGTRLVNATNGVLVFKANKNWTAIKAVRVSFFSPNTLSATEFNLKKNGVNLFADELTVPVGEKEIFVDELDFDVTDADEFRLDLTEFTGRVYAPIILELAVEITGGAGEANTASNVGTGSEVFKGKTGVDLAFRKINAGSNITVTQNTNDITISAETGGGSSAQEFGLACSDETTAITTGTNKLTFRVPNDFTLTDVRANLNTASSSGAVTVDINKNGASVLSTKLTIDQGEKTSLSAATAAVISSDDFSDDDEITIDIDNAGTGAIGLKVWLIGTRG